MVWKNKNEVKINKVINQHKQLKWGTKTAQFVESSFILLLLFFLYFVFGANKHPKHCVGDCEVKLKSIRLLLKIAKKNINKQMDVEIKNWFTYFIIIGQRMNTYPL